MSEETCTVLFSRMRKAHNARIVFPSEDARLRLRNQLLHEVQFLGELATERMRLFESYAFRFASVSFACAIVCVALGFWAGDYTFTAELAFFWPESFLGSAIQDFLL